MTSSLARIAAPVTLCLATMSAVTMPLSGSGHTFGPARFKVQGSRFTVQGSRFKVQGSKFKVQGSSLRTEQAGAALPKPVACAVCWRPPLRLTWQLQLGGTLDPTVPAAMYEIDMFDDSAAQVADLHRLGRKAICYVDAGSWENWRPDAGKFPKSVLGKPLQGWKGERWLDVRRISVLGPIIRNRVRQCKAKGFDGVDFDNVDGYSNPTGFPLTGADQLRYDTFLANLAHTNALSVALKNDPSQAKVLVKYFDWSVVEQCFQYQECARFSPFIRTGKPVFEVEYSLPLARFCKRAAALHFNSMRKHLNLGPWLRRCPP
ncbi:MAG TPA: endo alpha-1,4 polygalactosaminidase [Chloroflexota bacterium]|jgi:hypothetical protein|nr:endo alpha-1,4 polygalactosaminidase [Chloroflexota bacterium]